MSAYICSKFSSLLVPARVRWLDMSMFTVYVMETRSTAGCSDYISCYSSDGFSSLCHHLRRAASPLWVLRDDEHLNAHL